MENGICYRRTTPPFPCQTCVHATVVWSMRTSAFLLVTVFVFSGALGSTAAGSRINMRRAIHDTFVSSTRAHESERKESPVVDVP